jgi:cytoskeletal protein CcmA (bactofilin family)
MKPTLKMVLLASCLLFITSIVGAQSKERENGDRRTQQDLGERIGTAVENFIESLTKGLRNTREDEYILVADTVPAKRAAHIRAGAPIREDDNLTYEGDAVVDGQDTIRSNVVVKAGDLTVYGEVEGDVLVVGGDLFVRENGHITGNAKVINGEVTKDGSARIDGYIDKTSSTEKAYRESERKFIRSSTRLNANWARETTDLDNFIFRYNRVEGLFLGVGSDKKYYWGSQRSYAAYGSFGYGFKSRAWRGNLGVARQFAFDDGQMFEVGVEGHNLTDSKDNWIIGVGENTAAAILIHEDFRDYYRRVGYGISADYTVQQEFLTGQVKVEYLADRYHSMENRAEWSVFGGDKKFRLNPAIDEGDMRSVVASAGLSTVSKTIYGPEGWSIFVTGEIADKNFGSDFGFNQYVGDVRRYQPLGRNDNLNLRLRVGTTEGSVPYQKIFEFGGPGTLNGYPFNAEAGTRMILLNAEYIVNSDFLGDLNFFPDWLLPDINFLVLGDAGVMRTALSSDTWSQGFSDIKFSEFKHDVGVGVATRSGSFRMAFVWRTDRNEPARFIFRFARPF